MPGITSMSLTYSGQVYLKYMYLKSNHIKGIYIITFIKKFTNKQNINIKHKFSTTKNLEKTHQNSLTTTDC